MYKQKLELRKIEYASYIYESEKALYQFYSYTIGELLLHKLQLKESLQNGQYSQSFKSFNTSNKKV